MKKDMINLLKLIQQMQDNPVIKHDDIGEEKLSISYEKWCRLIGILQDEGLIKGFTPINVCGTTLTQYKAVSPSLTLSGMNFINQNENNDIFSYSQNIYNNILTIGKGTNINSIQIQQDTNDSSQKLN